MYHMLDIIYRWGWCGFKYQSCPFPDINIIVINNVKQTIPNFKQTDSFPYLLTGVTSSWCMISNFSSVILPIPHLPHLRSYAILWIVLSIYITCLISILTQVQQQLGNPMSIMQILGEPFHFIEWLYYILWLFLQCPYRQTSLN